MSSITSANKIAKIIDGKLVSKRIESQIRTKIDKLQSKFNKRPNLAIILVGNREDSELYVNMKTKAAERVGIKINLFRFDDNINVENKSNDSNKTLTLQQKIIELIKDLNGNSSINGILVQLPLPSFVDENLITTSCMPSKDVDGIHPLNLGRLLIDGHQAAVIPCTPNGCIELLKETDENKNTDQISGKQAVVIGRSLIVGKPLAILLQSYNATVTLCHSKTHDLINIVSKADIVVIAIGKPNFLKGNWLKPGCVVIDVGISSIDDSTRKSGYRLVGDVDFETAKNVAGFITPVPGGVGPMTIAMLLHNTVNSFELMCNKSG